jgi:hypothetical protein
MKTSTQLILTLFLTISFTISTQANSKKIYEGYVVTTTDETIDGRIKMLSPALNEVKVKFIGIDNKKKTYKAKELKKYAFQVPLWNKKTRKHETYWVTYVRQTVERAPIAFGPKSVLLHQEEGGKINMYNHYIEQNAKTNNPLIRIQYVEKEDSGLMTINKKNYKKTLKAMTAEYPELQAKIGTRGYGIKQINKIIAEYNQWMLMNGEEEFAFN